MVFFWKKTHVLSIDEDIFEYAIPIYEFRKFASVNHRRFPYVTGVLMFISFSASCRVDTILESPA